MLIADIILFFVLISLPFIWFNYHYQKSTYKKETQNSLIKVLKNTGLLGEYFTTKMLDKIPGYHKVLLNAYIPTDDNNRTEIDIIFLHETGVYVLESKNYSGWIYGREQDKTWTQTFKNGKKFHFYNPIKQNKGHIKALKNYLEQIAEESFKSFIIFSERCTLKNITVDSPDIRVLNRQQLVEFMKKEIQSSPMIFTKKQIDDMYRQLKPCCRVADDIKQSHIQRVHRLK